MPDYFAGYDKNAIYTTSTDKHGHSAQVRTRVTPGIMEVLGALVASRSVPEFRTVNDFVRDAIHHHLYRYVQKVKAGEIGWSIALEQAEVDRALGEAANYENLIESERELVKLCAKTENRAVLGKVVERLKMVIGATPEPWGPRLGDVLEDAIRVRDIMDRVR